MHLEGPDALPPSGERLCFLRNKQAPALLPRASEVGTYANPVPTVKAPVFVAVVPLINLQENVNRTGQSHGHLFLCRHSGAHRTPLPVM